MEPLFFSFSFAPYDRWGFIQKLEGEADEDAFLSMANKLDRRSDELKVNRAATGFSYCRRLMFFVSLFLCLFVCLFVFPKDAYCVNALRRSFTKRRTYNRS